jgi:hypothetical protein
MAGRDIVVIGGSAGSIEAVPDTIFVVVHFPGSVKSTLPHLLSRAGPL